MHRIALIGVSGQIGSGKDTVANYLCAQYGFVKVALADPIKRFGYHVFHFDEDQLWGPSESRNAIDERYNSEEAWNEAQGRLIAWGHEYITGVLGDDNIEKVHAAFVALVSWFSWLKKEYAGKLSPRIMLQALGTEWGRNAVHEDIWMNCLLRTVKMLMHEDGFTQTLTYDPIQGCVETAASRLPRGVAVSDIRFENEFKRIRDEGGRVLRVIRPDTDSKAATIGITGHASEAHEYSFENFDFIIRNDGTLGDLYRNVDDVLVVYGMP
jgi:hypothetical protein